MPKVLLPVMHRPNRSPSQRYRFEQYLDMLRDHGFEIIFSNLLNEADDRLFYQPGHYAAKAKIVFKSALKRLKDLREEYDIILIQREAFMLGTTFFEQLFSKKKAKIIFDFDDSIWLDNPQGTSDANRKLAFLKNPSKTSEIIKMSDMVFAGNDYLAAYARQYNKCVKIIPTTVNTDRFCPSSKQITEAITIGWSGSPTTVQHFEYAIPVLKRLKAKYGSKLKIRIMGDSHYHQPALGLRGEPWSASAEVPFLTSLDIGIMPLPDDEWTKGKCGLKGLTYMSCGVATIMSPVGVNSEIISDGQNGYLASTPEEWERKIEDLIENPDLRIRLGKAGRQTVIDRYSVISQRERYLQYFREVLEK